MGPTTCLRSGGSRSSCGEEVAERIAWLGLLLLGASDAWWAYKLSHLFLAVVLFPTCYKTENEEFFNPANATKYCGAYSSH